MNVSPSIGIAIIAACSAPTPSQALHHRRNRHCRQLCQPAAGRRRYRTAWLIVFFVFKKKIYEGNHALETEESAK